MINSKKYIENITHALVIFQNEVRIKAQNNLLDDNVLSENFIKKLLNLCKEWNLINLNEEKHNYPGIDLGDSSKKIGVQVTSDKTSRKITESLNNIVNNNINEEYDDIYFFILVEKQKNYSVKFDYYEGVKASKDHIWDFGDVIKWCINYDNDKLEKIWNLIQKDIELHNEKTVISPDIKKYFFDLKDCIQKIFDYVEKINMNHFMCCNDEQKKMAKYLNDKLEKMKEFLDEYTYKVCKDVLASYLRLEDKLEKRSRWDYSIEILCQNLLENRLIENNLQEAVDLIDKNITGLDENITTVIDGNELIERLEGLKLDKDIIYDQFSTLKFQKVIEKVIFRRISKSTIVFSKQDKCYDSVFIDRLKSEQTIVKVLNERAEVIQYISDVIAQNKEVVLISLNEETLKEFENNNEKYLYTIEFDNLGVGDISSCFWSIGNIGKIELKECFNYKEGEKCGILELTENKLKRMITNANDNISHQLRVEENGDIYISTITGGKEIEDLKFRWETWQAYNNYVGPFAASDSDYIKSTVGYIRKCWEKGVSGYCDTYRLL